MTELTAQDLLDLMDATSVAVEELEYRLNSRTGTQDDPYTVDDYRRMAEKVHRLNKDVFPKLPIMYHELLGWPIEGR